MALLFAAGLGTAAFGTIIQNEVASRLTMAAGAALMLAAALLAGLAGGRRVWRWARRRRPD